MSEGTEITLRNLGGKEAVKVISNDQGQVVLATEENVPLQPTNPGGKLDEYAVHDNEENEISALTEKGAPASADLVIIEDSEAGFAKKKVEVGNIGGGGASSFLGLSDTPNAYAEGDRGFLVGVEDLASPDELIFFDPAGLPVGAHNHDSVYSPLAHVHSDLLAKAGGIMSGPIDFSDLNEGIRFWDQNGAYFKGLVSATFEGQPMLVIGEGIPWAGQPALIHANTFSFKIGHPTMDFVALDMWHEDAGGFESVIVLESGSPGANLSMGLSSNALNFWGSANRPKYGGNDLAMFSDVPSGGTYDVDEIPHRSKGTGQFIPVVLNGVAVWAGLGSTDTARVTVRDMINIMKGGVASPSYSFNMNVNYQGWIGANADPNLVYYDFDFDVDNGTNIVQVRCSDGTTSVDVETYVLIQGTASGGS